MAKKEKSYTIKVPVYTTNIIENVQDLFGGITYDNMISYIKDKIKKFKEIERVIQYENRNKTQRTVVNDIEYTEHKGANNQSAILLKISAYTTNLYDGYFEGEEKIPFKKDNKIGSNTNFVMIYPVIKGLNRNNYSHYFVILIYEDPTKNNDEISKIAKLVMSKVFEMPITNIKLPSILEELKSIGTIPELQIKYSAVLNQDNDVDVKYKEYYVDGSLKKQKEDKFRNMPFEKVEELINEPNYENYQKKTTKLICGKKEFRISKELINEANVTYKESAEKVFNASTLISENDLNENIHNQDFIVSKLFPILENFLSTDL